MKFLHLSDLHLGKSVHEFSMLEDQEYILKVILGIADDEKPQAVLISGDVYDRTVAPTEAWRFTLKSQQYGSFSLRTVILLN